MHQGHPPPRKRPALQPPRRSGALTGFFVGFLLIGNAGLAILFWPEIRARLFGVAARVSEPTDSQQGPARAPLERLSQLKLPSFGPSRTIYLNREGARLFAGDDDARKNRSALVRLAGQAYADIPAFSGTPAAWQGIAKCLREKFQAFNVAVVEQRPVDGSYVMVVFGGTQDDLEPASAKESQAHSHSTGLAPFTGSPIDDAVVLVFSRTLKENVTTTCETAGMEIAHAYGLDHAYDCKDLMTYRPRCGARTFINKDVPCGEDKPRPCAGGASTQNSFARLLSVLGQGKP